MPLTLYQLQFVW